MPPTIYCGKCEHFTGAGIGAKGFCNAISLGTGPGGVPQWKVIMYYQDASKCPHFEQIKEEEVVTDIKQQVGLGQKLRGYKDFEKKERDVSIDPEKVKETKYWG